MNNKLYNLVYKSIVDSRIIQFVNKEAYDYIAKIVISKLKSTDTEILIDLFDSYEFKVFMLIYNDSYIEDADDLKYLFEEFKSLEIEFSANINEKYQLSLELHYNKYSDTAVYYNMSIVNSTTGAVLTYFTSVSSLSDAYTQLMQWINN